MRRIVSLLAGVLVTVPTAATGLTLEWAGGATNLDFTSTTLCTLVVSPSPGETLLPTRWRLFWTGRANEDIEEPVQILTWPGPADAAPVCGFRYSSNEEERQSHTATAEFCGPGDGLPTQRAAYVMLLHPSLEARLTVTPEFGPLTSTGEETPEVTVNGGTDREFPASLRTYRAIPDTLGRRRAGIVGRGLDRVQEARLVRGSASSATTQTIEILSQSDQTLTIETPPDLAPDDVLVLSNGEGEPATALLIDVPEPPSPGSGFSPTMVPDYPLEAKDFAFIYTDGLFHIFYIRKNPTVPDSMSEVDFGHAVSSNLYNWTQLPPVIHTRPDKWDNGHVWAPSIVEQDGTYHMFYTGVTKPTASMPFGPQRLGHAVSSDLYNWTRFDTPIFDCAQVPWTECNYATWAGSQFRDPFVMLDPNDPSRWLMYYVAILDVANNQQIVGVGQGNSVPGPWSDLTPLWCTDGFFNNQMGWCESPMAFEKNGSWFLMMTTNSGHPIRYKISAVSPIADSMHWAGPYKLWDAPGAGGNSDDWIAPEFLRLGTHDYLAVASRAAVTPGVEIREMIWGSFPSFSLVWPAITGVGGEAERDGRLQLAMTSRPGAPGGIELRVELKDAGPATVEIFDVGGRRVACVLDRWLPPGATICRWDGRAASGGQGESGVYFARLASRGESRAIRVAHLR